MKSPALYLLEVLFCSGLLLAFYRLLLVRKVSYAACRRYLVFAVWLSVVIPALNIPLYPARTVVYPLPLIAAVPAAELPELDGVGAGTMAEIRVPDEFTAPAVDWGHVARVALLVLYVLTAAVSLGILAVRIAGIRRLRRRSRITECGEYAVAENPQVETPFSFFRTVFLGEGYEGRRRGIVLCHEASHIRHRHTCERIAVESVRCIFWFNPFVWIAARWLSEVQEWEADRDVLDAGYDLTEYRTIIFRQLFGYNPDIACGLNHSLTKNRFAMMTQFRMRRFAFLRLGAAVPIVAGMILLCSFTTRTPDAEAPDGTSVHIGENGAITLNGRSVTRDELSGYVAAQRELLSGAGREVMQQLPAGEVSGNPATVVNKTVTFGSSGLLEVLCADRVYPSDVQTMIFAGNVRVRFRDDSPDPTMKDGLTEITCDSLIVNSADRSFECFDALLRNTVRFSVGDWYRISANSYGNWNREMKNVVETSLNTVLIQVSSDGNILLNGEPATTAGLKERLIAWRSERPSADVGAWIMARKNTSMGVVTDVKQALRAAGILRVLYDGTDDRAVVRMLPPDTTVQPVDGRINVTDVTSSGNDFRIKERNLFLVLVNGSGKVMAGTAGRQEVIDAGELTARVKAFVLNPSGDSGFSERMDAEFDLPGGGKMSYPVSQGVVSLQMARDASYGRYREVQSRIAQAFDDVRAGLALRQFGKAFDELSDAQRQVVMRAVPLKVSEAEPHTLAEPRTLPRR